MPKKPKKTSKEMPGGCLSLFGLPFLLAGLLMTGMYFKGYLEWQEIQSWQKTPCWITSADLKTSHDSESGDTHQAHATYDYMYAGVKYSGDQVSIHDGSDNIGGFQKKAYEELRAHLQPDYKEHTLPLFHCYVDPADPSQSVIYRVLRWEMQCFIAIFALTFPAAGAGLVFGGIIGSRMVKKEEALALAHPNEPWKARTEWSGPVIPQKNSIWKKALHAYTLWSALIIVPLIYFTAMSGAFERSSMPWVTMIFVAVWLVPAWFSLKHWRSVRTVGRTHFRPEKTPFVPGGAMGGAIVMKKASYMRQPLEASLICEVKHTYEGSDGDETSTDHIWEHHELIPLDGLSHEIDGYVVPVTIDIPHDAPNSGKDPDDERTEYDWILAYKITGTAVSGSFSVPVFGRNDASPQGGGLPSMASSASKSMHDGTNENLALKLNEFRIRSSFDADNLPTNITCPPCRSPGMIVLLLLFNLVWTFVAVWLLVSNAPLLFKIIWPVTATGIWIQIFWMLLHKRTVQISPDRIEVTNRLGPFTLRKSFSKSEISGFDHNRFGAQTSTAGKPTLKVRLLRSSGGKCTLADNLHSTSTAQALVQRMTAWLERS